MQTKLYRDHHAALRALVAQMPATAADLDEKRTQQTLIKLTGLLKAHLKLEDEHLYPAMRAHRDPTVRAKAERFQEEMGGLASAYTAFYTQWVVPHAIERDGRAFLYDWTAVRRALSTRMDREDDDLYALVDDRVFLNA